MHWVMIFALVGEPLQMQEFDSKGACQLAAQFLLKTFPQGVKIARCVKG